LSASLDVFQGLGLLSLMRPYLLVLMTIVFIGLSSWSWAGPPYITDDPVPVDYQHWEVYIGSQYFHLTSGVSMQGPLLEINEGVIPNLQLHVIAPFSYVRSGQFGNQYGYGDTEFGVKYRFVQETANQPMVGIYPLVEIPTGNAQKGLGNGQPQIYLPVWIQKSWGRWTSYGGGGYWMNPGPGNQNWWFTGALLQRSVTDHLAIGIELYHATPNTYNGQSRTSSNIGIVYDMNEGRHLLFSIGRDFDSQNSLAFYVAHQWTFGPPEKR